jgi:hypothetical protein
MWLMSLGDMPQAEKLCGHRRITLRSQLISAWYRFTSPKPTLLTPQLAAELLTRFVTRPRHLPPIKKPAKLPKTGPASHELFQQPLQDLDVLRERVNLNTRNSFRPASSAGLQTPPRTS